MAEHGRSVPPPIPPTVPLTFPPAGPPNLPLGPVSANHREISNPLELGRCLIESPCSPKYWLLNLLVQNETDK